MTDSTGTVILRGVKLHDSGSNLQSFARQGVGAGSWFFAQVMQDGRFGETHDYHLRHGDLTLTRVTVDGSSQISYMYLRRFGHGVSMSIEGDPAGGVFVWIEAAAVQGPTASPDAWGTKVARVKWVNGATRWPSSAGVDLFDPFPSAYHVGPSLDVAASLITVRHMASDMSMSYTVFDLDAFKAGDYSSPLADIPTIRPPGPGQGWGMMPGGQSIAILTGRNTSAANPPPGDTELTTFDATGRVLYQKRLVDLPDLQWREPEGVQPFAMPGVVCNGWGSGPSTARVASIVARPVT